MGAPNVRTPGTSPASADTKTDAPIIAEPSDGGKGWAVFSAACAVSGVRPWLSFTGGTTTYIVSSHGRTREFADMADAARWIALVSGVHHG